MMFKIMQVTLKQCLHGKNHWAIVNLKQVVRVGACPMCSSQLGNSQTIFVTCGSVYPRLGHHRHSYTVILAQSMGGDWLICRFIPLCNESDHLNNIPGLFSSIFISDPN